MEMSCKILVKFGGSGSIDFQMCYSRQYPNFTPTPTYTTSIAILECQFLLQGVEKVTGLHKLSR